MPSVGYTPRRTVGALPAATTDPAPVDGVSAPRVVRENIEGLIERRRATESKKGAQAHLADLITRFSGSVAFVYLHAAWFLLWTLVNIFGWFGLPQFDRFPFGLLTMIVSLEAIFLSSFVLISQNRLGALADSRADLDLQINLLAEHELTEALSMLAAIAEKLGIPDAAPDELEDLKEHVAVSDVLDELARYDASS